MFPIIVVNPDDRDAVNNAMHTQEHKNEDYPGLNSFQIGLGPIHFYYKERYWTERLMLALMAANIPFKVEYAENMPSAFTGFFGKYIKY